MITSLDNIPANIRHNLRLIMEHFEERISITQFAQEYFAVSHQTVRSWLDEGGCSIPPVDRIVSMRNALAEKAPEHPLRDFTLEQFYNEKMVTSAEKAHYASIAVEYRNLLGNYILYCYNPFSTNAAPEETLHRPLRYFVVSVFARYDAHGMLVDGEPGIIATPFESKQNAIAFLAQLNERSSENFYKTEFEAIDELYNNALIEYDECRDYYKGELRFLKDDFFMAFLDNVILHVKDCITLCLKRPGDREESYIGGQGLMTSITRYPVAQEAILSRNVLDLCDEPIARFLDVDFEIPDLENELHDAVRAFRGMTDKLSALDLPDEDANGILVHRIIKLYDAALRQVSFSHFSLDASGEEYSQIQSMLVRHADKK